MFYRLNNFKWLVLMCIGSFFCWFKASAESLCWNFFISSTNLFGSSLYFLLICLYFSLYLYIIFHVSFSYLSIYFKNIYLFIIWERENAQRWDRGGQRDSKADSPLSMEPGVGLQKQFLKIYIVLWVGYIFPFCCIIYGILLKIGHLKPQSSP